MNTKTQFAVSVLLESVSREDFAIHLYSRQYHRDPFATVPFSPLYYVLDEVYFLKASPINFIDLLGIVEVEIEHKRRFTEAAKELNPTGEPVAKVQFPEDLFETVTMPEVEAISGMKTATQIVVTDHVQEQRARLIYDYFAKETSGQVSDLFKDISVQEMAHKRIFERALKDLQGNKKINMFCPVCGKVLNLEPEEGYLSGCAFCKSRLILKIEDEDFILYLRDEK
jgi:rubrerythrin